MISRQIARREFLRVAAAGIGAAAAAVVTRDALAANDVTEGTLSYEAALALAPVGFQATAFLDNAGWTSLPSAVSLTLQKVAAKRAINSPRFRSSRTPFVMTFIASQGLRSGTYRIVHPAWSQALSIFLSPVGKTAGTYEAIFN